MTTFERELEQLVNRYSKEKESNTPDFILAQYLLACLAAWNVGVQQRETWYGRDGRPGAVKQGEAWKQLRPIETDGEEK